MVGKKRFDPKSVWDERVLIGRAGGEGGGAERLKADVNLRRSTLSHLWTTLSLVSGDCCGNVDEKD